MESMWRRRLIMILTLIAAVEIVTLGVRGFLAETLITPLLYLVWGTVRIFESIPQGVIWITFVLAAGIVALVSVWGDRQSSASYADVNVPRGRVYEWQRLVTLAQQHDYSRWRLAQRLMLLLAEAIAAHERVELRVARQRIANGRIDASRQVIDFLRAGTDSYRPRRRMFLQRSESALDADLDQVVAAIERLARGD
ncbi:MAG: hypothetical protein ACUVWS_14675 [Roseiflexus sp.]